MGSIGFLGQTGSRVHAAIAAQIIHSPESPHCSQVASKGSCFYSQEVEKETNSSQLQVVPSSKSSTRQEEVDISDPYHSSVIQPPQTCCLIDKGERCHQYVVSYEYSKTVEDALKSEGRLKLKVDCRARHKGICDYHSTLIADTIKKSMMTRNKRKNSFSSENTESNNEEDSPEANGPGIDFSKFPLTTLQKYKKVFTIPGQFSKAELANVVAKHFKTISVVSTERKIISNFIYKVKYSVNYSADVQ